LIKASQQRRICRDVARANTGTRTEWVAKVKGRDGTQQDGNMTGIQKGDIGAAASMAARNASPGHGPRLHLEMIVKITRYCTIAGPFVSACEVRDAPHQGRFSSTFACIASIFLETARPNGSGAGEEE
jgi:hypothetical protein